MYRILIVEDDTSMAQIMKKQIESWGNEAQIADDFRNILPAFTAYDPHLVLLDIMLPFFNGYHWCSEIRKISTVPVVFLSSTSDNMNILMAMNMGADDFLPNPVDLNVLIAKLNSVLRRVYDRPGQVPVLEHGGAVLNLADGSLTYEGNRVELTKNEFRILQTLMEHRGKIVSRDALMTRLWQDGREMIASLSAQVRELTDRLQNQRQESLDYYTTWVHQIKTPIAALHMLLEEHEMHSQHS